MSVTSIYRSDRHTRSKVDASARPLCRATESSRAGAASCGEPWRAVASRNASSEQIAAARPRADLARESSSFGRCRFGNMSIRGRGLPHRGGRGSCRVWDGRGETLAGKRRISRAGRGFVMPKLCITVTTPVTCGVGTLVPSTAIDAPGCGINPSRLDPSPTARCAASTADQPVPRVPARHRPGLSHRRASTLD